MFKSNFIEPTQTLLYYHQPIALDLRQPIRVRGGVNHIRPMPANQSHGGLYCYYIMLHLPFVMKGT